MYPLTFVSAVMYSIFSSCNSRRHLQCAHSPVELRQSRFPCSVDKFAVQSIKRLRMAHFRSFQQKQKAVIADSLSFLFQPVVFQRTEAKYRCCCENNPNHPEDDYPAIRTRHQVFSRLVDAPAVRCVWYAIRKRWCAKPCPGFTPAARAPVTPAAS